MDVLFDKDNKAYIINTTKEICTNDLCGKYGTIFNNDNKFIYAFNFSDVSDLQFNNKMGMIDFTNMVICFRKLALLYKKKFECIYNVDDTTNENPNNSYNRYYDMNSSIKDIKNIDNYKLTTIKKIITQNLYGTGLLYKEINKINANNILDEDIKSEIEKQYCFSELSKNNGTKDYEYELNAIKEKYGDNFILLIKTPTTMKLIEYNNDGHKEYNDNIYNELLMYLVGDKTIAKYLMWYYFNYSKFNKETTFNTKIAIKNDEWELTDITFNENAPDHFYVDITSLYKYV